MSVVTLAIIGGMASALIRLEQVVEDGLDRRVELGRVANVDGHAQPPLLALGLGEGEAARSQRRGEA